MPLSVYGHRQKMSSLAKKCRPLSLYHLTVRVQYHSTTTVATVVVVDIGNIIKETLRHNRCPSPSYTAYCKRRCPKKSGFSYLFIMPYTAPDQMQPCIILSTIVSLSFINRTPGAKKLKNQNLTRKIYRTYHTYSISTFLENNSLLSPMQDLLFPLSTHIYMYSVIHCYPMSFHKNAFSRF